MLNPKLRRVCEYVDSWCRQQRVLYSVVCDESDLQGLLLPRKDRPLVNRLVADLGQLVETEGVHLETTKVRGGTILAFSVKAISESKLAAIIAEAGEVKEPMNFTDKIDQAFVASTARPAVVEGVQEPNMLTFLDTALKMVGEGQYKSATQGMTRANQTSLQRQRVGSDNTLGGPNPTAKDASVKSNEPQSTSGAAKGPNTRFESRVAGVFDLSYQNRDTKVFQRQLAEALDGMATPSGVQPGDLFTKFAQSLAVLGQNMGTGPLQDQLKKQGINWKKSDDGQSIILYIVNASTNAPQPIARISAATLEKPSDFETQLLNIMDFAKGEAPGTFKQKQEELQAQEKAAREIAKQLGPQDQNAIAQQMQGQGQQPGLQGMAMPDAPGGGGGTPPQPAPQAAAQQAAMPKPGM